MSSPPNPQLPSETTTLREDTPPENHASSGNPLELTRVATTFPASAHDTNTSNNHVDDGPQRYIMLRSSSEISLHSSYSQAMEGAPTPRGSPYPSTDYDLLRGYLEDMRPPLPRRSISTPPYSQRNTASQLREYGETRQAIATPHGYPEIHHTPNQCALARFLEEDDGQEYTESYHFRMQEILQNHAEAHEQAHQLPQTYDRYASQESDHGTPSPAPAPEVRQPPDVPRTPSSRGRSPTISALGVTPPKLDSDRPVPSGPTSPEIENHEILRLRGGGLDIDQEDDKSFSADDLSAEDTMDQSWHSCSEKNHTTTDPIWDYPGEEYVHLCCSILLAPIGCFKLLRLCYNATCAFPGKRISKREKYKHKWYKFKNRFKLGSDIETLRLRGGSSHQRRPDLLRQSGTVRGYSTVGSRHSASGWYRKPLSIISRNTRKAFEYIVLSRNRRRQTAPNSFGSGYRGSGQLRNSDEVPLQQSPVLELQIVDISPSTSVSSDDTIIGSQVEIVQGYRLSNIYASSPMITYHDHANQDSPEVTTPYGRPATVYHGSPGFAPSLDPTVIELPYRGPSADQPPRPPNPTNIPPSPAAPIDYPPVGHRRAESGDGKPQSRWSSAMQRARFSDTGKPRPDSKPIRDTHSHLLRPQAKSTASAPAIITHPPPQQPEPPKRSPSTSQTGFRFWIRSLPLRIPISVPMKRNISTPYLGPPDRPYSRTFGQRVCPCVKAQEEKAQEVLSNLGGTNPPQGEVPGEDRSHGSVIISSEEDISPEEQPQEESRTGIKGKGKAKMPELVAGAGEDRKAGNSPKKKYEDISPIGDRAIGGWMSDESTEEQTAPAVTLIRPEATIKSSSGSSERLSSLKPPPRSRPNSRGQPVRPESTTIPEEIATTRPTIETSEREPESTGMALSGSGNSGRTFGPGVKTPGTGEDDVPPPLPIAPRTDEGMLGHVERPSGQPGAGAIQDPNQEEHTEESMFSAAIGAVFGSTYTAPGYEISASNDAERTSEKETNVEGKEPEHGGDEQEHIEGAAASGPSEGSRDQTMPSADTASLRLSSAASTSSPISSTTQKPAHQATTEGCDYSAESTGLESTFDPPTPAFQGTRLPTSLSVITELSMEGKVSSEHQRPASRSMGSSGVSATASASGQPARTPREAGRRGELSRNVSGTRETVEQDTDGGSESSHENQLRTPKMVDLLNYDDLVARLLRDSCGDVPKQYADIDSDQRSLTHSYVFSNEEGPPIPVPYSAHQPPLPPRDIQTWTGQIPPYLGVPEPPLTPGQTTIPDQPTPRLSPQPFVRVKHRWWKKIVAGVKRRFGIPVRPEKKKRY
ncbi:uncharacterized protein IL334_000066 [Kwoniella shivajii]|uniref:Fork-head domain-containing protein n=1 Tax=Kwoniella shivajii TaxID=564305 RepID=A0ABZ1CNP1_9TREE|nr:hypothetical protein IL334_000066 [Kwoniella shivajii]